MIQDVKLGTHRISMYMYAISKCTFLLGFHLDLVLEALCIFLANLRVSTFLVHLASLHGLESCIVCKIHIFKDRATSY